MTIENLHRDHLITTDNKIMDSLGLNNLTLDDLYLWVAGPQKISSANPNNDVNTYYNMQYIKYDPTKLGSTPELRVASAMDAIIGAGTEIFDIDTDVYPDVKYYELSGGRLELPGGDGSTNYVPILFRNVVYDNILDMLPGNNTNTWGARGIEYSPDITFEEYLEARFTWEDLKLGEDRFKPTYKDRNGVKVEYDNQAITRVIAGNRLFNNPLYEWPDDRNYNAWRSYLQDIKLNGGIKWTNIITVTVPGTDPVVECDIEVEWCLTCFGKDVPKKRVQAALLQPNITKPKTDEHNVQYKSRNSEDLRRSPNTSTEVADMTSAELDTHFNEWTKKFESGTKQVIAVMTTDLPAATPPDTDDGMLSDPLEFNNNQNGFRVTHGKARPLSMKNNPTQWGPEWKYLAGCDSDTGDNCDILEVCVQNKLATAFGKGETVILNKIGGVWQPSISSSGEAGVAPPAAVGVTKWSFVSMMSNAAHYFVSTDKSRVLYSQYEQGIYDKYYDVANPSNTDKINHAANGYIQLSSFDMMGPNVGGTRAKHALGKVSVHVKNDGTEYDNPISELNPLETTPFFGAYFPDGYAPGDKYNTYTNPLPDTLEFTARGDKGYQDIGYMKDIPTGTIIFDNAASTYSNIDGSPFASIGNDTLLYQLPADIALNADPRSDNGQPLTVVSAIHSMFNVPLNSQDMQAAITNTMADRNKRYMWLSDKTDENSPTFDLNPINNTRVVFRPLKAEVYSVYELIAGVNNGQGTTDPNKRGSWSSKIYGKVTDGQPAISTDVLDRVIFDRGVDDGIWGSDVGLKHQKDLDGEPFRASENSAYPDPFYRRTWPELQEPRDVGPSTAYGVIGAQCTVTANTSITFNTANVFGMKDYLLQGATTSVGGIVGELLAVVGGKWNSCHGGDSTTYYSRNNTILQARIFHQHPRELTVYDPRFFSVFHFASGIGQDIRTQYMVGNEQVVATDPDVQPVDQVWANLSNNEGYDPLGTGVDGNNEPFPEKWQFHIKDYASTDFREPTFIGGPSAATGVRVTDTEIGLPVARNNPGDPDATPAVPVSMVWRDPAHWQINPDYRGKLLPYVGARLTVGIDPADIVIVDGGGDYSDTDTFTTNRGAGVSLKPIVDGDGAITGFEVIPGINGNGYDFEPDDFFTQYDLDEGNDTIGSSRVQIIADNVTSGGVGLQAYVQRGVILSKTGETIAKPEEISPNQSQVTLTPKPPIPRRNGSDPFIDQVTASLTQTVQIANQSDNNQYDIFFHYHNDISHVWHESSLQTTLAVCRAQHVDLTISPA